MLPILFPQKREVSIALQCTGTHTAQTSHTSHTSPWACGCSWNTCSRKTSSLLIFSFPWAQTAGRFFEHHLMLREEGNPRNKRTARCDESRTGRHAPATWTDEIHGTGLSLAISSNSNTTFVLQNGITNTNTRRKYSVSWGPAVLLVEHRAVPTWISVLHWQEEKKQQRNRTRRKNSSGQASNKRNVKFLNWLGDQHNTQEKRSFSSQFLVQLLTSSLHLSLLPFIYLFYFFRPKMSLRTTLPCICVVETNSLLIAERFRSTMMRATRASKNSLLPPAPLFIQKEIKGLISSRRAVTPADKSSLQTWEGTIWRYLML